MSRQARVILENVIYNLHRELSVIHQIACDSSPDIGGEMHKAYGMIDAAVMRLVDAQRSMGASDD